MSKEKKTEYCRHRWAPLLALVKKKIVPISVFVCLKCGDFKIGGQTIRISRHRLDMGGKPVKNVSKIDISERLKIPVGTDKFD